MNEKKRDMFQVSQLESKGEETSVKNTVVSEEGPLKVKLMAVDFTHFCVSQPLQVCHLNVK